MTTCGLKAVELFLEFGSGNKVAVAFSSSSPTSATWRLSPSLVVLARFSFSTDNWVLLISVEVVNARDRFSGALSSAVDKVESGKLEGEAGQSYFLGSPVKRHLTYVCRYFSMAFNFDA